MSRSVSSATSIRESWRIWFAIFVTFWFVREKRESQSVSQSAIASASGSGSEAAETHLVLYFVVLDVGLVALYRGPRSGLLALNGARAAGGESPPTQDSPASETAEVSRSGGGREAAKSDQVQPILTQRRPDLRLRLGERRAGILRQGVEAARLAERRDQLPRIRKARLAPPQHPVRRVQRRRTSHRSLRSLFSVFLPTTNCGPLRTAYDKSAAVSAAARTKVSLAQGGRSNPFGTRPPFAAPGPPLSLRHSRGDVRFAAAAAAFGCPVPLVCLGPSSLSRRLDGCFCSDDTRHFRTFPQIETAFATASVKVGSRNAPR